MEKRIGIINIVVYDLTAAKEVNSLLSSYSEYILSRNGLPLRDKGIHIINIVAESSQDIINSLTGKLGRILNVEVKCLLTKIRLENN
ncbi:MAG: hypothetical protein IJ681_05920 [Bacteroidales bacterium]|nr:hypothetical protein [Bacteroidales bacterium]